MLSSVLRNERAVQANIEIMRTFVKLREMIVRHKDLERRLEELEARYEGRLGAVFQALRRLLDAPEKPRKPIGFRPG